MKESFTMQVSKKILEQHLKKLVNRKVSHAKLGFGSFFTLDFGKDVEVPTSTNTDSKSFVIGEWEIWINMAFWEFEKHGKVVLHSEDEREDIEVFLKKLENKTLIDIEITSDKFDMVIQFEDDIDLYIIANTEEDDNEQWSLFIPDGRVLVAGPGTSVRIEE